MPVDVRLLSSEDRGLLRQTAPGTFDHAIDDALTEEFLNDPRHDIVVAVEDGTVVGFASAIHYVNPDKPREMWINEVGVAPSHQRNRIASAILQRLLARAQELGCSQAWVLTDADNLAANRLYKGCGGLVEPGHTVMYSFALRGPGA